jgi:hypothetical protein
MTVEKDPTKFCATRRGAPKIVVKITQPGSFKKGGYIGFMPPGDNFR